MYEEDIQKIRSKNICFECIGEDYLREEVRAKGKIRQCSYCKQTLQSYKLQNVVERVKIIFTQYYSLDKEPPVFYDENNWVPNGDTTIDTIENIAVVVINIASDIQKVLAHGHYNQSSAQSGELQDYDEGNYYVKTNINDEAWQEEWRKFENSLKGRSRFFNREAENHLKTIFQDIETKKTRDGKSLIILAGIGQEIGYLYRARYFQDENEIEDVLSNPIENLGPPPRHLAKGGRMNAHGISVFYGSNDADVAIAEIRPPVGSYAIVCRFKIIEPLRLLDLNALANINSKGSYFDSDYFEVLQKETFLRNLSRRISIPVMPMDESLDYLPTQAIADYLASLENPSLDGVIFRSTQATGDTPINVVLFHKSSRVKEDILPKGWERVGVTFPAIMGEKKTYNLIEQVSISPQEEPFHSTLEDIFGPIEYPYVDPRLPTLEIDLNSIEVRNIIAVSFATENYKVSRSIFPEQNIDDVDSEV